MFLLSLVLILSTSALGHARVERTEPTNGATLDRSPAIVLLAFDTPVKPTRPRFTLVDDEGNKRELAAPDFRAPSKEVHVQVPALSAGTYRLRFSVVSNDGHRIRDSIRFTIRKERRRTTSTSSIHPAPGQCSEARSSSSQECSEERRRAFF